MGNKIMILVVAIIFAACNKPGNSAPSVEAPTPANGIIVSVVINQNQPGYTIPVNFEGFSYEVKLLTSCAFFECKQCSTNSNG